MNEQLEKFKEHKSTLQIAFKNFQNPYGKGGASERIANILENINYNTLLKKSFIQINKN